MVRSAYRSRWRLHRDPTILTPGRYYFADEETPAAPFPTLLGSREWDKEDQPIKVERIWGEWTGKQIWDAGAKPDQVPEPRRIGSLDCLGNGATNLDVAPGNPLTGPFRTVCIGGVVYTFPANITVSFNVAYQNRDFTYYGDVPLSLAEADCEARYEGITPIPFTWAILKVADGGGGNLVTNFYLCERLPPVPPIIYECGYCPLGTFFQYSVVLEGIVADPAHPEVELLNGEFQLTYTEACRWVLVLGDFTLTLWRFEPFTLNFAVRHGATLIMSYQTEGGFGGGCMAPIPIPFVSRNAAWVDDSPAELLFLPVE